MPKISGKQPFTIAREELERRLKDGELESTQVAAILAQVPAIRKRAMKNGQWFQDVCEDISANFVDLTTNRAFREFING